MVIQTIFKPKKPIFRRFVGGELQSGPTNKNLQSNQMFIAKVVTRRK